MQVPTRHLVEKTSVLAVSCFSRVFWGSIPELQNLHGPEEPRSPVTTRRRRGGLVLCCGFPPKNSTVRSRTGQRLDVHNFTRRF